MNLLCTSQSVPMLARNLFAEMLNKLEAPDSCLHTQNQQVLCKHTSQSLSLSLFFETLVEAARPEICDSFICNNL